jgi:hypothetical protein
LTRRTKRCRDDRFFYDGVVSFRIREVGELKALGPCADEEALFGTTGALGPACPATKKRSDVNSDVGGVCCTV